MSQTRTMYRGAYWINDMFVRFDMPAASNRLMVRHEHHITYDPVLLLEARSNGHKHLMNAFNTGCGPSLSSTIGLTHLLYCLLTRVPYCLTHSPSNGSVHLFAINAEAKAKAPAIMESLRATSSLQREVNIKKTREQHPWWTPRMGSDWATRTETCIQDDLDVTEHVMPNAALTKRALRNVVAQHLPWYTEYRDELIAAARRRRKLILSYRTGGEGENHTVMSVSEGD